MNQPTFIVSLHDVTESTFDLARRQMDELTSWGVRQMSLLVVPCFHGQERLDECPPLCEWLRKCQSERHEIVLHGWRHLNTKLKSKNIQLEIRNPKSEILSTWFYENFYTSGESEFLNLDYKEAFSRIEKGLTLFRDIGLKSQGFIAPAWLMNSEVEKAARDLGLVYTNTISELIHLPTGQRDPTRSCVWSTRTRWRRLLSLAWNHFLFKRLQSVNPLRISLHPHDLKYPSIWKQIKIFIQRAHEKRRVTTYSDWIQSVSKS